MGLSSRYPGLNSIRIGVAAFLLMLTFLGVFCGASTPPQAAPSTQAYGVQFSCLPSQLDHVSQDMSRYLQQLGIPADLIQETFDRA